MSCIALKVDVDTYDGTRLGTPRLAQLLERLGVGATFLFCLGPDHTGRAIRRVFRRGFLGKVQRTSVVANYGLRTLLYGTLLPGPHIARRCRSELRRVAELGFEVGVHAYDHVRWQDSVSSADKAWTRRELARVQQQFAAVFDRPCIVHGAAGWQMNRFVPALQRELGIQYASDTRGVCPFIPVENGKEIAVPQLPTTLPTLDELIGREDLAGITPVDHLISLTAAHPARDQVFTLHAEMEGGAYLTDFERLVRAWQAAGHRICSLGDYYATLDCGKMPRATIVSGEVAGRTGTLACQAGARL